jgi:predicted Rossmann fold nucleotide-binding protein DprA/Smf involved in DNA uptake
MQLEENAQAILLLSAHFGSPGRGDPTPLTPAEYGKLSAWLHDHRFEPKDLLQRSDAIRSAWEGLGTKITLDRLDYLVGRAMAMGVALEKWNSAGIWILTRADAGYPKPLRRHLGVNRPPVLFGVGNQRLLDKGGLAVVGSRDIDAGDRTYAEQMAQCAAHAGLNVVSGGAKGVDETAMRAALEAQGTAVGVLANGLLPAALSGRWRSYLKSKDLCLASPYYPEAGFNVGNAMGRNKYIYCLSDYALVVRSDRGKGGTWAGATEALKKRFAPVFVKAPSEAAGNTALIDLGAHPLGAPRDDDTGPEWLAEALRAPEAGSPSSEAATASASPQVAPSEPAEQESPPVPTPPVDAPPAVQPGLFDGEDE